MEVSQHDIRMSTLEEQSEMRKEEDLKKAFDLGEQLARG
jgi:hypothetical protein